MVSRRTTIPLKIWLGVVASFLLFSTPLLADRALVVDFSRYDPPADGGALPMFWNGSGFNPANRDNAGFNDAAQNQNMLYLGSIPHDGVRFQRPHFLLELIGATGLDSDSPTYDWTDLDSFLDIVVTSGQALFFQLMGNPGSQFTDFAIASNIDSWKTLVRDLAIHLEDRYGTAEVRGWFFETWNEPDIDFGWTWDTEEEFYNYYDACSEGLLAADPQLRLGGPGVANIQADLLEGLIDHSFNGKNYFTGETGVRLDFISYHVKDLPAAQVSKEISSLENLIYNYPSIADTLFVNNEADSECCWWHEYKEFRATAWYAAFIARQVNEHLMRMVNGMNLKYRLANDNAFLGSWPQRTHLTRFGDNVSNFALIKKPAHNIMTLLSLLGDRQASVSGYFINDDVGALSSMRGVDQAAILVYHYNDNATKKAIETISLAVNDLPFATGKVAHYRIDLNHSDTYAMWQVIGSPTNPNADELAILRDVQEVALLEDVTDLTANDLTLSFDLPLPGVSLILLSADPGAAPPSVSGVAAERFPSLTPGKEDVVVSWKPASRFVRTYEVLHSPAVGEPFQRINTPDIIATAFLHPIDQGASAYFKVQAIDYWGRQGTASAVVATSSTAFIIDNTDLGFVSIGDWKNSTFIAGFYGSDYLHDGNIDQGTKSARWTPNLPEAGMYEVAIWYPSDAKKATNVPVTITHHTGVESLLLDQNENGSTWVVLGSFFFAAGTGGYVEISNDGTNNFVVADAVRFSLKASNGGPNDNCPNDPNKKEPGICGCGVPDTDTDVDGTPDCIDSCLSDPNKIQPGVCGCGIPDIDTDNDGTMDCDDNCPNDPDKTEPGICGCGSPDTDTDNDGTLDCKDNCPTDPNKTNPGVCGCGVLDVDVDQDGIYDCNDDCDSSLDSDGDGFGDCDENCPNDPNKTKPGICGCGVSDIDTDTDTTPDCNDTDDDNDGVLDEEDSFPLNSAESMDTDADGLGNNADTDDDNDGISDLMEGSGPNDGDSNNDGILDSLQNNLAYFEAYNAPGAVVLESSKGTLSNCQAVEKPSPDDTPVNIQFDYGFFDFTISGISAGGNVALTITLIDGKTPITYYKYGKTPDNQTDHWYEFLYDGVTGAEIIGNVITLHFVDALRGDDILIQDSKVIDMGAPGFDITADDGGDGDGDGGGGGGGGCFIDTLRY